MLLSKNEKKAVKTARVLSSWFQVKIEIRLFGKLVWSYCWPPESKASVDDVFIDEDLSNS